MNRVLDPAAFLQVTLFELFAFFSLEAQPRIANRRIHFSLEPFAVNSIPRAHQLSFFRPHLNPMFGVLPEYLSIFRWHRIPAFTRAVWARYMSRRRRHSSNVPALRLGRGQLCAESEYRNRGNRGYNV